MAYLIALLLPLTFLYSPRVEKSNLVLLTRTMTITQERNTPAYALFQQTQEIHNEIKNSSSNQFRRIAQSQTAIDLNVVETAPLQIDENETNKIHIESAIKIDKVELNKAATEQLTTLFQRQPSSTDKLVQMSPVQIPASSALIRGHFELKDGLGLVDQSVILKRTFEGQVYEIGQVDLKAGQYQIAVSSFEGEITAEIKDRAGILIGEVREKILNLKRVGQFYEGPVLKVGRPSAFSFNPNSIDQRKINDSTVRGSFFSGNYNLKKTTDSYPNVSRHSSTLGLIKDESGKIATTLSVRTSAEKSETILFSKQWVEGVQTYISEQVQIQYLPESGTIIGRVMKDEKPVVGAEVLVENQPGVEPYYLDQFLIPHIKQVRTSENGFFIIPGLQPGAYEISAFVGEKLLGSQQYLVETALVTYQEIQSGTSPQSIIARSFDAFGGESIATDILIPGMKDVLTLEDGVTRFKDNSIIGLTEIINRPAARDYAAYVYLRNHNQNYLHLPQIKDAFLEYVVSQLQISKESNSSILVGFTPSNHFDVHIADPEYTKSNIAYFDSQGNLTTHQIAGGGFVAFNLPQGIQEIILQDQKTDRSFSVVLYSRPDYLFVSHFSE